MIKSLKSGFTLAEVLTTLMVIGVVAAMTIPTLMNSTSNQQARVAAKKAMSTLSQATQLLVAKEEECNIESGDGVDKNAGLASCFQKVIAGSTSGNAISTPDGMIYKFYAAKSGDSLAAICGEQIVSYSGSGNCAVIVDTNGNQKGSTTYEFPISYSNSGFTKTNAESGTDIIAFSLSATSARPMAFTGGSNYGPTYILGSVPTSLDTKGCYKKDTTAVPCPEGKDTSYSVYTDLRYIAGDGSCESNEATLADATKALTSADLCPAPAGN